MSVMEKFLTGAVGVALFTTMILPGRQTPAVVNAGGNALSQVLGTVMGLSAPKSK